VPILLFINLLTFSVAWSDVACVAKCASKPGRGNACFKELCQRNCDLLEKHKGKDLLRFSENGDTLYITGLIESHSSEMFLFEGEGQGQSAEQWAAIQEKMRKVRFIVLNSPGGDIETAQPLLDWVEKKGSSIKVIIPHGGICASACAEIFRCAQNRVADKSALLMFHPGFLEDPGNSNSVATEKLRKYNEGFESRSCPSKAAKSPGGREITEALKQGKETCYYPEELSASKDFLELEGDSGPQSGMIQNPLISQ